MKIKTISILVLFLLLAGFTSACSGSRLAATNWPGLSVDEDTFFLANGSFLYAIQAKDGDQLWQYPVEADRSLSFYAAPVLTTDGQLIAGDYTSTLHSLDPTTGLANPWSFDAATNRFVASPLTTPDGIFAPSTDGNLYALDLQGNLLWEPFQTEQPLWATPATDGQNLYLPSLDHKLYAIDVATGREVWSKDLGSISAGTPTISSDGVLYLGTFDKTMLALDPRNGATLWETPTSDWVWSGPTVMDDQLFFGDLAGTFYALDRSNGNELWKATADGGIVGTPLVTEEAVYFGTEMGTVFAYDLDGRQLWTQSLDGKIFTRLVMAGDVIAVATMESDTLLTGFNPDGNLQWTFTPQK